MTDPDIWTATRPDGPSRSVYILLGVGFGVLFGTMLVLLWVWRHDAVPWVR